MFIIGKKISCAIHKIRTLNILLKSKGWKNIHHAHTREKKAAITIQLVDKTYCETRNTTRNKKGTLGLPWWRSG